MDLARLADGLHESRPGYWLATADDDVSYPAGGHGFVHDLESESFWYRHRTRCILAAMRRHAPPGPVFDVGGGTGHVAASLVAAGVPTIPVEPGRDGAEIAWERGLRPVVQATTVTAGFHDRSLPAVGLFDVVEHVEDDVAFMQHVRDLLEPGGVVYLTVPAHQWLWSVDDVRAGHFRRYTVRGLERLLDRAGLQRGYLGPFFRPLPLPVLLVRGIPSRLGMRHVEDRAAGGRDHLPTTGLVVDVMNRLLAPEVDNIARGRRMRTGSSILAVARRR